MTKKNVTRGEGILEGFLAGKRTDRANSLIENKLRNGRILDVGCGFYPHFLLSTDFKEKHGIDPSTSSKLKSKKLNLKRSDIEKGLPYPDNYFDVVTMLAVFEHINQEKLSFVLSEIRRVLKKNGQFVMTTPAPWSDRLLHLMARTGLISKEEIHDHKHNHAHDHIRRNLNEVGFIDKRLKSGYFELGLNMWFVGIK